jgi:hypothetical protein
MRFKAIIFFISTILTLGCGNTETTNGNQNSVNAPNTNTNTKTNADNPLETTKKAEVATTNNAPTLTPVVKAYCEAIIKKDEAALRKIYSQDTLKVFEKDMKAENKTSLAEFLSELDPIKDVNQCSARNEKIEGDKAVANIKNENMTTGFDIEFVKENGEWKLTNKSSDFESVKQSATNSNTGK